MALKKCSECGHEVSKKAASCPNCGSPAPKKTSTFTWLVTGFLVLVFLLSIIDRAPPEGYPTSKATYAELNRQVGCDSEYSDQKKRDIFKTNYRNHWMTWSGEVVTAKARDASLNIDGKGTQDLQVDFADRNAGYNLKKGNWVKVKFLMKMEGGCFLPFSGKEAVIL